MVLGQRAQTAKCLARRPAKVSWLRVKIAHSVTHFYYVLCSFSRPFAYMPDDDRSGCAVVVETVLRILHTDERQATSTYDSPLAHPYLSCEYFTEFHAVSRLAHKFTHLSGQLEGYLSVRLGAGAPEYSPTGRAYDGIRPGIWQVHVERAGSVFDGKGLPGCLDGEWMSTPRSGAVRTSATTSRCVRATAGLGRTTCSHRGRGPCGRRPSPCTPTRRATGIGRGAPTLRLPPGLSPRARGPCSRGRGPRRWCPVPACWRRRAGATGPR